MGVGVVLPWMGLDILFFDEFFLLPIYAVIGIADSMHTVEPAEWNCHGREIGREYAEE